MCYDLCLGLVFNNIWKCYRIASTGPTFLAAARLSKNFNMFILFLICQKCWEMSCFNRHCGLQWQRELRETFVLVCLIEQNHSVIDTAGQFIIKDFVCSRNVTMLWSREKKPKHLLLFESFLLFQVILKLFSYDQQRSNLVISSLLFKC